MSKFYTQTGDDGYTGRLGKGRYPKHHILIETVGSIDEASAALGFARSQVHTQKVGQLILMTQKDLYHIMAELSATPENAEKFRVVDADRLAWLEKEVEIYENEVDIPAEFIVPGDSQSGAALAVARTIIRRCERRVSQLHEVEPVENPIIIPYLNRLSSLCFVLELIENQSAGSTRTSLAKDR